MYGPGGQGPVPPGYPGYPAYTPVPKVRFEAISEAWRFFQQQMGTWIAAILILYGSMFGVYLLFVAVMFIAMGGASSAAPSQPPSGAQAALVFGGFGGLVLFVWIGATYLTCGLFRMAIKQIRGEYIGVADLFGGWDTLPAALIAGILSGFAGMVGMLLCVIPAYIVQGLFMLTYPLIVDQRVSAVEAMTQSWNALKTDWLMATVFCFVLPFVVMLGLLACGIGVIFTMPLFYLCHAIIYRDFFLGPALPPSPYGVPPPYSAPPPGSYPPG